jgi:hypothetical protein
MKKFMVLYIANGAEFEKMIKNSTPEQQKKGMDAWMKWMGEHKAALVDGGAPLGKTKRVVVRTDAALAFGLIALGGEFAAIVIIPANSISN